MFFVYVIQSKEGYVYVGSTSDVDKRVNQHNQHLAGWTKRGTEWNVVHLETFSTLSAARKRERWFKTGVGRDYIASLLSVSGS